MMPPTSIDGTDITGATIDGDEVQEITVDGQTVFSAGPAGVPDSALYHYPILQRGNSTIVEELEDEDATAQGTTNTSGNWFEGFAEDGDGSSGYISGPTAWYDWIKSTQDQWLAFTIDATGNNSEVFFGFHNTSGKTQRWRIRTGFNDTQNLFVSQSGDTGGEPRLETSNAVLDGQKHRVVYQRTGTNAADYQFWVDGNQENLDINQNETFDGSLTKNDIPYFLAAHRDGSTTNFHADCHIDNIIFGQLGTTLSQQEIQDDYNSQPW